MPIKLLMTFLSLISLIASSQVLAGTIMGNGGALEVTQELNYGELLYNSARQAQSVANQITAQITRAQELVNSYQNLVNAPAAIIAQTIAPYQNSITSSQQLLNSVTGIYGSYNQAAQMVQTRIAESQALGIAPQQYLNLESQLAAQKGGIYAAAYQRDTQTLQDVVTKSQALQNATSNIPSTGAVQGLDKLNAMTAMVAGETMALRQQIADASAQKNQEKLDQVNQDAAQTAAAQNYAQQLLSARQKSLQDAQQPTDYSQQQIRAGGYKALGQ